MRITWYQDIEIVKYSASRRILQPNLWLWGQITCGLHAFYQSQRCGRIKFLKWLDTIKKKDTDFTALFYRYKRLVKIFTTFGVKGRPHGNTGKTPKHACTQEQVEKVINFLVNYADANALPLPGRLPNCRDYRWIFNPTGMSSMTTSKPKSRSLAAQRNGNKHV